MHPSGFLGTGRHRARWWRHERTR